MLLLSPSLLCVLVLGALCDMSSGPSKPVSSFLYSTKLRSYFVKRLSDFVLKAELGEVITFLNPRLLGELNQII